MIRHFLLENPWPVVVCLVVAAAALGWRGFSSGERGPQRVALGCGAAALGVFLLSFLVTTAAEHGVSVVRELVNRAEQAQTGRMPELFVPNATMHYGAAENPGVDMNEIRNAIATLGDRYKIKTNRITQLEGTSASSTTATVLLTCFTDVQTGFGPTPNSWWFEVTQQPDGAWKVKRMALLKVGGQKVSGQLWR